MPKQVKPKPTCKACSGTRINSRGGPCAACEVRSPIVPSREEVEQSSKVPEPRGVEALWE